MAAQTQAQKLGAQLYSTSLFGAAGKQRKACSSLAGLGIADAVPFLVCALVHDDDQVRAAAAEGLKSLTDSDALAALQLGYAFTRSDAVKDILGALGQEASEVAWLSSDGPSVAEKAWQAENEKDGTVLALVPAGEFQVSDKNFKVSLPPYYMAQTAVTNAQFARFLTGSKPSADQLKSWVNASEDSPIKQDGSGYAANAIRADHPVHSVLCEGAQAYCKWAGLRLPTELEWEKAARGVDGRVYPWGHEWGGGRPHPGEEKTAGELSNVTAYPTDRSPYGLYQMIGGPYEWSADWYEEGAYGRYARGDLKPPAQSQNHVLRGGTWTFGAIATLRTPFRQNTVWRAGTLLCGLRCARSL